MRRYFFWFIAPACFIFIPAFVLADTEHLVISQVQITGGTGMTNHDFVEIFNPTDHEIDLNGMVLVKRTSSDSADELIKTWDSSTLVPAFSFYLIAHPEFITITATRDAMFEPGKLLSSNNGLALRMGVVNEGVIIDSVGWGSSAPPSFIETAVASTPGANKGLTRKFSTNNIIQDTNSNSEDFKSIDAHPHNLAFGSNPPVSEPAPLPETPPAAETEPVPPLPVAPLYSHDIIISEFLPNPDGKDDGEEWIELYNRSDVAVDLSGWILDDEGDVGSIGKDAYVFPDGSSIAGISYLVVNLPAESFALNNTGGDTVRLLWPDKNQLAAVYYLDMVKEDTSYALKSSDIYNWTNLVTKGQPNQFAEISNGISSEAETKIKINEIFPNPKGADGGEEWIEVTNTGTEPVYIHNWTLDDGAAADKIGTTAWKIQSPIVGPGGFAVLAIPSGKFSLNNTADTVRLFNENQILIDSVVYADVKEDLSYALVDGKWVWGRPTPNAANNSLVEEEIITSNIVINEIFPEPPLKSQQEEFIELYNPGTEDLDLTGFKLADAAIDYKLKEAIAAGGYLVIFKSVSKISLNNTGKETVSLIDPKGVIVASVEYEDAPQNQSYNLTNGGLYAWSSIITAGEKNQIKAAAVQIKKPVKKSTVLAKAVSVPVQPEVLADGQDTFLPQPESLPVSGQIAGANVANASPAQGSRNWLPWIMASFALNLAFCYILVTLMLRNKRI